MESKNKLHDHKKETKYPKYYIEPKKFFIGFLIASFTVAFIIGGIAIGRITGNEGGSSSSTDQDNKDTLTEIDNPQDWKPYSIDSLNLELKLPNRLVRKGDWFENKIEDENGTLICFTNKVVEKECEGEILIISSSANDYSNNSSFFATKGFTSEDGNFKLITTRNDVNLSNAKLKIFEGNKELDILKIVGDDSIKNLPKNGHLGAIIKTNNQNYPAVLVQMKIDSDLNEFEFDQILRGIQIEN